MKTNTRIIQLALAASAMLLMNACSTPPTVVTQTTTTTETTEVTRGNHSVAPATTVIYPSHVQRSVVYTN